MNFDLISDISAISTVPYATMNRLCDKGNECICHNVLESMGKGESSTEITSPIGTIRIIVEEEELHYRFSPSKKLEELLIKSITEGKDPLIADIETSLVSRILNTYKDLI